MHNLAGAGGEDKVALFPPLHPPPVVQEAAAARRSPQTMDIFRFLFLCFSCWFVESALGSNISDFSHSAVSVRAVFIVLILNSFSVIYCVKLIIHLQVVSAIGAI
jgi:hypothetical protein